MAVLSPPTTPSMYPQASFKSPKDYSSLPLPLYYRGSSLLPLSSRFLRLRRSHAALSPPPPPPSEPPPEKDPARTKATLSKFQDHVRIFLAVFFWLSLFFWASAWNGRNDGGGPNKGSRF